MRKLKGDLNAFEKDLELFKSSGVEFISKRYGSTGCILYGGNEYVYSKTGDVSIRNMCASVTRDAKKYLKNNNLDHIDEKKVVHFNRPSIEKMIGDNVVGIDINACYWTIAKRYGIIGEKTYLKGLQNKTARLIATGSLAKKIRTVNYANGEQLCDEVSRPETYKVWNLLLDEVYKLYLEARGVLGDDFYMWLTDCVYTSPRRAFEMIDFFTNKGFDVKFEQYRFLEFKGNNLYYLSTTNDKIKWIGVPMSI